MKHYLQIIIITIIFLQVIYPLSKNRNPKRRIMAQELDLSIHRTGLIKISANMYAFVPSPPERLGSNSVIIIGKEKTAIVDAQMTPDRGREVWQAYTSLTNKPLDYLILTHWPAWSKVMQTILSWKPAILIPGQGPLQDLKGAITIQQRFDELQLEKSSQ
jgi:hypothetical protein